MLPSVSFGGFQPFSKVCLGILRFSACTFIVRTLVPSHPKSGFKRDGSSGNLVDPDELPGVIYVRIKKGRPYCETFSTKTPCNSCSCLAITCANSFTQCCQNQNFGLIHPRLPMHCCMLLPEVQLVVDIQSQDVGPNALTMRTHRFLEYYEMGQALNRIVGSTPTLTRTATTTKPPRANSEHAVCIRNRS